MFFFIIFLFLSRQSEFLQKDLCISGWNFSRIPMLARGMRACTWKTRWRYVCVCVCMEQFDPLALLDLYIESFKWKLFKGIFVSNNNILKIYNVKTIEINWKKKSREKFYECKKFVLVTTLKLKRLLFEEASSKKMCVWCFVIKRRRISTHTHRLQYNARSPAASE